jgi:hypothetical protein
MLFIQCLVQLNNFNRDYMPVNNYALLSQSAQTTANISALRASNPASLGNYCIVSGLNTANDGMGGMFVWNASSTAVDDGYANIVPTGSAGTGVWQRFFDKQAVQPEQRPRLRSTYAKLATAAAGTASQVKMLVFGDSVADFKGQFIRPVLNAAMGGIRGGIPTAVQDPRSGVVGAWLDPSIVSGSYTGPAIGGDFTYWVTGSYNVITPTSNVNFLKGGSTPLFTNLAVYYVLENGAGSLNVQIAGTTVQTINANNSGTPTLGVYTYTQTLASKQVSLMGVSGNVKILEVHYVNATLNGVDLYDLGSPGQELTNMLSGTNAVSMFQQYMTNINPDLFTFEMHHFLNWPTPLSTLSGYLNASIPNADILFMGPTPSAPSVPGSADPAGTAACLAYNEMVRALCLTNSYIFFNQYEPFQPLCFQTIANLGWQGDGVHLAVPASAWLSSLLIQDLGIDKFLYGYTTKAVNDPLTPSNLAWNSIFRAGYSPDRGTDLGVNTDSTFGYDWTINFPRTLSFATRGNYGTTNSVGWQFSGNTAVNPNIMPLNITYNNASSGLSIATDSTSGYLFTKYINTANPTGLMNVNFGLVKANFTRTQLLALHANSLVGSIAFCTDCTGGAALVYARGNSLTDWVTVAGNAAI